MIIPVGFINSVKTGTTSISFWGLAGDGVPFNLILSEIKHEYRQTSKTNIVRVLPPIGEVKRL